jgi:hypothetical protein
MLSHEATVSSAAYASCLSMTESNRMVVLSTEAQRNGEIC